MRIKILQKGFTLIELLIVIAIMGVLASLVLIAINPTEQLARGRDSGRKTAVSQLASAMQAYYTAQGAVYPAAGGTWIDTLKNAGELKTAPAAIAYSISGVSVCSGSAQTTPTVTTAGMQSNFCYQLGTANKEVLVYTRLESTSEKSKCTGTNIPFFVWSSKNAQAGVVCVAAATEPSDPDSTSYSFL